MAKRYDRQLDVICMMGGDGAVVPIKIRIVDDDGERQVFVIQECTDLSHQGTFTHADGMYFHNEIYVFDCKIQLFDQEKRIRLYYDAGKSKWTMSA